ncbi:unnamed protein product [Heligmosomoides polygyrus]|uniref:DUF5641 domain-containing protein n=1 Tax=Heligmosomoides polygyrus TaxID=6339 RepID=A0A183G9V4_HELPZ|nr:unnamed protein product [Heligmosomoides polygyrus]
MSDNAPTFKLGREVLINELQYVAENNMIKDFSTATGFEWKFITPLSSWKGGFYERLFFRDSLHTFWDIWHKECLRALAERNQVRSAKRQCSSRQPKIGDVVIIETDNIGRSHWPLGVVVELRRSLDGAIRSVRVRTSKRHILDRSTNQLIPLEVAAADENSTKVTTPTPPTRIQPPRAAKKTTRQ